MLAKNFVSLALISFRHFWAAKSGVSPCLSSTSTIFSRRDLSARWAVGASEYPAMRPASDTLAAVGNALTSFACFSVRPRLRLFLLGDVEPFLSMDSLAIWPFPAGRFITPLYRASP